MKFYFILQIRRAKRKFEEIGIHPILGMALLLLLFIAASSILFYKTEFAPYIYGTLAILSVMQLGDRNRISHIDNLFNKQTTNKIRLTENGIATLPFLIYLLFQGQYMVALAIVPIALALAFSKSMRNLNFPIPTPFKKFPFEFIVGFRKTFWLIGLLYLIIAKAIQVNNFNLGLVSFGALFLIAMTYYFKPEDRYFAWIHKLSATQFLKKKCTTALICMTIVSLPAMIILLLFYPENWLLILGIQLIGSIFLCSMILAKYSAFPKEMSLPQAILYGLSLWFPPMLLIVIPIFYKQSKRKLEPIL